MSRPERARVSRVLNAYYRIEQDPTADAKDTSEVNLDEKGFDAQKYFDTTISWKDMTTVRKLAKALDREVQDLDAEMQELVFENYSKFTHAAGVIKQMKFCFEGMQPDINLLEQQVDRLSGCQRRVEDGVDKRAYQIDDHLKQQRVCKKLQVLFALPDTLKRCLDHGQYGQAVEAYCSSSDFLRQYTHVPTFNKVLLEAEHQMQQIGSALETRLRAPYLSVDEAVNSSVTLLDMGKDQAKVAQEYLGGRMAVLRKDLERCFDPEPLGGFPFEHVPVAELTKDQKELRRPESVALHGACWRAAELYVPQLCDAVEGFQKIVDGRAESCINENSLPDFASARVEEMCDRFTKLIEQNCPSTRVLVSCVHLLRDGLRRLHLSIPAQLTRIFTDFLCRTASCKLRGTFAEAATATVQEFINLHAKCSNASLDGVLEQIAKTEQVVMMRYFRVLTDCQALLSLLNFERASCTRLVGELRENLVMLLLTFVEVCHRYIGQDPQCGRYLDESLAAAPVLPLPEMAQVDDLEWNGVFALALVRVGRHLELKAINKVFDVARDLFSEGVGGSANASAYLAPHPASLQAVRFAAQGVMTHYVQVSGQKLAYSLRNFVQNKNWMTVPEPRSPSILVEKTLAKEVHTLDAQVARLLGDPRKPRASDRRPLRHLKTEMELEIERLVVKQKQVFKPIPFNRNGAIGGILRIAFKALYEYLREETFSSNGVQQIQLDCAFLAEVVRDYAEMEDVGALESLLDEAVVSAQQRSEGAVLLQTSAVEALIMERRGQGGGQT